jgi:hypothetical protein
MSDVRRSAPLLLSVSLALAACAAPDPGDLGDTDQAEDRLPPGPDSATSGDDKADGTELRVRAAGMTMWVDRIAVASRGDGGEPVALIEGRTSRNLGAVSSWVPDDAFGAARQLSARTFEIELRGGHEVNTLLSGLPIFVALDTTSGSVTHYEGMIALAPRFAGFAGAADLAIDAAIDPVWAGTTEDPLRYRGRVSTAAAADAITAEPADGAPAIERAGDLDWWLEWSYSSLEGTALAGVPVRLTATMGAASASAQASVELHAVEIGLTIQDPREAWPSATCGADTRSCVRGGGDLTDCGLYREVSACLSEDPCPESQPLELIPADASAADAAVSAFRAGCGTGGDWCSLSALRAFTLPACLSEPATLEAIVLQVRQLDQEHSTLEFSRGEVLDRAGAAATPFFATTYSDGGPGLLDALDELAGGAATIEAWSSSEEVPCPNCTDFQDTEVLFYPDSSSVILVDGGHGFDS